jgi:hypothetical protein
MVLGTRVRQAPNPSTELSRKERGSKVRGGNTSFFGSLMSFVVLAPFAIFVAVLWLWDFTKGFLGAALDHFFPEDEQY